MPIDPLLAQMNAFEMRPEHFASYVGLTMAFLFLVWLTDTRARPLGTTLILWGLLVVIFSCGYGLIGIPTMMLLTPALMKIGFLLVLGGLAWSLLTACPGRSEKKEADHV